MNVERFTTGLAFPLKFSGAIVSGLLLVLSLPKLDLYHFSWISLLPLLLLIFSEATIFGACMIGYAAGLAYYSGTFYWIATTMSTYGGISPLLSLGVFALFVLVFSLHTAIFAAMLRVLTLKFGSYGLFLAGPLWVAIELLQTYLIFGGFPWMLVGYALVPYIGTLQVVTWTGVYGLSFLLVSVNAIVGIALLRHSRIMAGCAVVIVLLAITMPVPGTETPSEMLSVRLVQTNIDIEQSWDTTDKVDLLDELHVLSTSGNSVPDLVIWPETPAPFYLDRDLEIQRRMRMIAGDVNAYLLLGYIGQDSEGVSNSAGLLSPNGKQISRYDKIHLVPFGEYVPMGSLFFFAESMVRNVGDFHSGSEYVLSSIDGHKISTTICYEDVFPDLIRQFTKRGAEMIINISNDGWFGSTSAPYQHLRMASVRAVENRRYFVRSTNTGISAIIDPYGRVLSQTKLGERTTLEGQVGYRSDLTFYSRYGDVFAYLMVAVIGVAFLVGWRWKYIHRLPNEEIQK